MEDQRQDSRCQEFPDLSRDNQSSNLVRMCIAVILSILFIGISITVFRKYYFKSKHDQLKQESPNKLSQQENELEQFKKQRRLKQLDLSF